MSEWKAFWNEEDGFGTVELVILIAVLVAIAIIFGTAVKNFVSENVSNIFDQADNGVNDLLSTGK